MTPAELAVVRDALLEAGLNPDQVRRAVSAIDAEEMDVAVTRAESRWDHRHYFSPPVEGGGGFEHGQVRTTLELEVMGLGSERFRIHGVTRILLVK